MIKCPECDCSTRVINTEQKADQTHRWRRCNVCDHSFRTVEIVYIPPDEPSNCVLTEENVRMIRFLAARGKTQAEIAAEYGLHRGTVNRIVTRRTWAHVV